MKSSTRYTLIATGFVVFLILAPLLIFYVSGRPVNLEGVSTDTTGILDAKTNPSGAQLLINDKDHSTTPSIARFLTQGEYVFTLRKEGYYDWSKRLPIESSKVTYAQEGVSEVQLIKKTEPRILLQQSGITSFVLLNDQLWFSRGKQIVHAPLENLQNEKITQLSSPTNTLAVLRNKRHIYIGNNTVLNTSRNALYKLPVSAAEPVLSAAKIAVTPNDIILYLNQSNNLYAFNPSNGKETLIRQNVSALTMLDNIGYFSEGQSISTAFWNGSDFREFQTLAANVPPAEELHITDNKELFCVCDKKLQRVGQQLELVASKANVHLDLKTNELAMITTSNELMFYNFLTSKPQLLTRGNLKSENAFLIRSSIGYGFIGNESGLEAIEIDSRDKQNRYQLISGKQVWQIAITENQKTILVLMDGSIAALDIRN